MFWLESDAMLQFKATSPVDDQPSNLQLAMVVYHRGLLTVIVMRITEDALVLIRTKTGTHGGVWIWVADNLS